MRVAAVALKRTLLAGLALPLAGCFGTSPACPGGDGLDLVLTPCALPVEWELSDGATRTVFTCTEPGRAFCAQTGFGAEDCPSELRGECAEDGLRLFGRPASLDFRAAPPGREWFVRGRVTPKYVTDGQVDPAAAECAYAQVVLERVLAPGEDPSACEPVGAEE